MEAFPRRERSNIIKLQAGPQVERIIETLKQIEEAKRELEKLNSK